MPWKQRLFEIFVSQKVFFSLFFAAMIKFGEFTAQESSSFNQLMILILAVKAVDYLSNAATNVSSNVKEKNNGTPEG